MKFSGLRLSKCFLILCAGVVIYQPRDVHSSNGPWSSCGEDNTQHLYPLADGSYSLKVKEDEVNCFKLKPVSYQTKTHCMYSIYINESYKDSVKLSTCFVDLPKSHSTKELKIVAPRNDTRVKPFNILIKLKSRDSGKCIQQIYLRIQVEQGDSRRECNSAGDPHVKPFPDQYGNINAYDFYESGDYYLLRTTPNHIGPKVEVQVRQFVCSEHWKASCDCGVFAREGNTIVGLSVCDSSKPSVTKHVLDNSPSTAVIQYWPTKNAFKEWKISLLSSGIVIDVDVFIGWSRPSIRVYVFATQKQLNDYTGLCSPEARNRLQHKHNDTFFDISKVSTADSFFELKNQSQTCWEPTISIPSCNCQNPNCKAQEDSPTTQIYNMTITCKRESSTDSDEFTAPPDKNDVQRRVINEYPNSLESKRLSMEGDEYKQQERLIEEDGLGVGRRNEETFPELMNRAEDDASLREVAVAVEDKEDVQKGRELEELKKRQEEIDEDKDQRVASSTITEETATKSCTAALPLTPTYDLCRDRVDIKYLIDTCVTDTMLMDDYGPVKTAPTEFERACLDNITLSLETPSIAADRAKFYEVNRLKTEVEKLICPLQCNQRGKCVKSKCVCESDYIGSDCSLKKYQVPTIHKILLPVCDIQNSKSDCQTIDVEAIDVVDKGSVTCQMRSPQGSVGGGPDVQTSTTPDSGGLVACRLSSLPFNRQSTDASRVAVYTVQVSISNDGQNFSNELPFTVFDGRCVECTTQPEISCKRKANGCDNQRKN